MTACFYARVPNKSYLEHVEFYRQDIDILRDLGFTVVCATRWTEIPRKNVDLFYIWWWTWAFQPLTHALLGKHPALITGVFDQNWRDGRWDFDRRPWWERQLIRFGLRRASANVFDSRLEYERVPRIFPVNNPYYSPHSVDTTLYCPGNGAREDMVLTVAWMHGLNAERKCLPELLRAAKLVLDAHPGVHFIIVGERGSYYPKLATLAEDLGIADRVEFPGTINRARKIELMQRCKVYLQPTRYEGFGLAILEAMSCGAAVVTSPAGVVPEVVGETAVLVDGTNPDAIATGMIRLLEDEGLRIDLGRRARCRAESEFPYTRRKNELRQIITQLLQTV